MALFPLDLDPDRSHVHEARSGKPGLTRGDNS
jgi:hypothetical protein